MKRRVKAVLKVGIPRKNASDRPPFSTGLSRNALFSLRKLGSTSLKKLLEDLGRPKGVTSGTLWVVLDRARLNGLVRKFKAGRDGLFEYELTEGGIRRVEWLRKNKGGSS